MEYKIVEGFMPLFEDKVNQALSEGWELGLGFTCVYDVETGFMFYAQVMLKTSESAKSFLDLEVVEEALGLLDEHEFIRTYYVPPYDDGKGEV